ncbi:MAG: hypothetical protein IT256_09265, partial [Chitinophagaceae bacterium]|nr:hypothetical protein [Chitinophagaceae bacterium]
EINNLQKCVVFGANSAIRSAEPIYNNSFSSFSMPPNTKTLDNYLPPLNVGNASVKAATNSQILFAEKNGNALWATLSGGQPTAVISGEGLWRWRMYEFKNTNQTLLIDECIRQTINMLTANNNGKPFYTELAKNIWNNPEHVQISAFLQNENNELINQPEATLSIKDSAGFSKIFNFERNGNSYKIDVGALPVGRYTYTASTTWNNKQMVDNGQFLIAQNALEDQESGCNYALMYALANKNNGNTVGTNAIQSIADSIRQNNNIRPLIVEQTEATELINWKWLFAIILLIATTEWLLRKYWMAM